jgi:hypothetical protein
MPAEDNTWWLPLTIWLEKVTGNNDESLGLWKS